MRKVGTLYGINRNYLGGYIEVTALPESFWDKVVQAREAKDFQVLTNVNTEGKPLPGFKNIVFDGGLLWLNRLKKVW